MSIVGDWHGGDDPVALDAPYVLCGYDFGDPAEDDSWSNAHYSAGLWGTAYAMAYTDTEPPVFFTEVCSQVWANPSNVKFAAAWQNGGVVSWYPALTAARWEARYRSIGFAETTSWYNWAATAEPSSLYGWSVSVEWETEPEITGWWFKPIDADHGYFPVLSPVLKELNFFIAFWYGTTIGADTGYVDAGVWDYYQAPDDIGTFADDATPTAFLAAPTATASSAVASAAGLAHGKVYKSPYFDRLIAAVADGELIGTVPIVGSPTWELRYDTPAPGEYGRPHLRFLACPTSATTPPTTPYEPIPNPALRTDSSKVLLYRTGPTIGLPVSDGELVGAAAPWLSYKPEYRPLRFQPTYTWFHVFTTTGVYGTAEIDMMMAHATFPWTNVESDEWIAGLVYTVDWGDHSPAHTGLSQDEMLLRLTTGHIYIRPGIYNLQVTATKGSGSLVAVMSFYIDGPTNTLAGKHTDSLAVLPHVRIAAG